MSQNMQEVPVDHEKTEISVRHLLFYVAKRWRLIFLAVLACIVVALLVSAVQWVSKLTDENYISPLAAYESRMAEYSEERLVLEDEITALEDELNREIDYDENSILMHIDPYNKKYATLTYYIDARESTLPDNLATSSDYTNSLLKTYMLYLSGGDLYAQILERFPKLKSELYIREILLVSRDDAASMITVTVLGSDDDILAAMLDIVRDGMAEVNTQAIAQIGSHQLTEIRSNTYTVSDATLAQKQKTNKEQLAGTRQELVDKQIELEELNHTIGTLTPAPVWLSIAKQLVKTALYAAAGSFVMMILLLALYYILTDKVLDTDKLQSAVRLDILGKISGSKPKRNTILDKLAAAIGGVRLQTAKQEDMLALTAQSIRSTVLSRGIAEGGIALVGNMMPEELARIAGVFNEALAEEKLRFTIAGDPMQEVASVDKIQSSVTTVVVVKQGVSRCSDIMQEAARLAAWGKPVLGAVLLDADTV